MELPSSTPACQYPGGVRWARRTFSLGNIIRRDAMLKQVNTAHVFAIVRLLRPRQWVKNLFVCAGMLFGGQWHDPKLLLTLALTFGAFSLMGSSVYVFNDYLDRESDRNHPTKRARPLASGAVTPAQGFAAAAICFCLSIVAAWSADIRVLVVLSI